MCDLVLGCDSCVFVWLEQCGIGLDDFEGYCVLIGICDCVVLVIIVGKQVFVGFWVIEYVFVLQIEQVQCVGCCGGVIVYDLFVGSKDYLFFICWIVW